MKQKKIPTVYLVDSENVNDVWIRLVTNMAPEDEVLVFYTEKSPHMSYEKVIELTQLADRPIRWIKCVEGSNALDFQLVTELGARVATEPGHAFVIVSNDNGFDAAVKYWIQRDKDVRRMKSAECRQLVHKRPEELEAERISGQDMSEKRAAQPEDSASEQIYEYQADIEQLSRSIQMSKLTLFHDAFVCMYDQEIGDEIYYYMKEHQEELKGLSDNYLPKRKARLKNYFYMALSHAGGDTSGTDEVMEIYNHIDEPKKNLQKLNVEAVKKFGQEQGSSYYKVLKKHVKIMSKL
ncbi:MAG: PIN domain-containing protein [Lachnospiraceae bacterium]|nr:PIN domain-containing protein [bacterium]MDY5516883.1 PIN domain-containing protein [Lachnospiraceae bacterium]